MIAMKIVRNENTLFIDVDDTLVMHGDNSVNGEFISILDPLNVTKKITLRINKPMIRLLKEERFRGSHVVVWSRGGYKWAENVINALGLQKYVDQIMTKPVTYFDDKPVEEWLKYRVYFGPDAKYKE